MVTELTTYLNISMAFGLGAYLMYVHRKLNLLERYIETFPTTEELAKEIVSMKLPISELPEELKRDLNRMVNPPPMQPEQRPPKSNPITQYIG